MLIKISLEKSFSRGHHNKKTGIYAYIYILLALPMEAGALMKAVIA